MCVDFLQRTVYQAIMMRCKATGGEQRTHGSSKYCTGNLVFSPSAECVHGTPIVASKSPVRVRALVGRIETECGKRAVRGSMNSALDVLSINVSPSRSLGGDENNAHHHHDDVRFPQAK